MCYNFKNKIGVLVANLPYECRNFNEHDDKFGVPELNLCKANLVPM